jgi:hypothetical protein
MLCFPDDDLQLGFRVKRMGLKQRFVTGKEIIRVGWYGTIGDAVRGLEKNSFAGMNYSVVKSAAALIGQLFGFIFPFAGIIIFDGWIRIIYIAVLVLMSLVYNRIMKTLTESGGYDFILIPVYALLFIFTFSRAIILTLVRGGIRWRDTFYSLQTLRRG